MLTWTARISQYDIVLVLAAAGGQGLGFTFWQRLLQNQRGAVVAHAVRRDTDAAICRLRFRLKAPERR